MAQETIRYRHSAHYLGVLRDLNKRYSQGENATSIYNELSPEWEQIKGGYEWSRRESLINPKAKQIFESYQHEGEPLLSLGDHLKDVLPLEERLRNSASFEDKYSSLKDIGDFYLEKGDDRQAKKYFVEKFQLIINLQSELRQRKLDSLQEIALVHWKLKEYRLYTKLQQQITAILDELLAEEKPLHTFISYSREDVNIMRQIRNEFTQAGVKVWVDEDIEPASNSWRDLVVEAIKTSGCFVIILTPNTVSSEWVNKELVFAKIQGVPIFPLMVSGDKKTSVPIEIGLTQDPSVTSPATPKLPGKLAAICVSPKKLLIFSGQRIYAIKRSTKPRYKN